MTMEDVYWEMAMEDEYLEEIKRKAIDGKPRETIREYYLYSKTLFSSTTVTLQNAKSHLAFNPTSTIIYAAIAQELMLKELLFKPIIFGVVNNEDAADIVIHYIFHNKSPFNISKINDLVWEFTRLNFHGYKRKNSKQAIWQEMDNLSKMRNKAMHQGVQFTKAEAKFNLKLVHDCFDLITTEGLSKLGLVLNKGVVERKNRKK